MEKILKEMFLTSKNLRVGNYINYECTTHVVSEIHTEKIIHYWINSGHDGYVTNYNQILSIPITIEEVIKFGFHEDDYATGVYSNNNGYSIVDDGEFFWLCRNNRKIKNSNKLEYIGCFDFVHELQNLYFDVAKKELKY
jgi:hypothetical protein